ncbi:hypothetical protein VTG60DRAFT_2243 [Thermothelomyces hinnuleus]
MAAANQSSAVNPQLESRLVQVPLEILLRITSHITTPDLGNVRLSCRALERSLFNSFAHEFFRKKQFMATTDSLQALIDISKHPTLSPVLKHVILSVDRPFIPSYPLWNLSNSDRNSEARARLELAKADQMHLLVTGGLRDMLAEAFANLANLEIVDIRDFNSPSRSRDGPGTQWTSWGAKTLSRLANTPVEPRPEGDDDPYTSQLFAAVVAGLAVAQARPKSLEVPIRGRGYAALALHDTAFYIPPRIEGPVSSLLANLKTLHLTLDLTHPKRMRFFMLQRFLSRTINLTWLRLNFTLKSQPQDQEELLLWLALKDSKTPVAPFDAGPIQLVRLERLDLGTVVLEPRIILGLASKFAPTLRSLYLRQVSLQEYENARRRPEDLVNPWKRCLTELSRIRGLNLRVLDLSSILVGWDRRRCRVSFKVSDDSTAQNWTCSTDQISLEKAVAEAIEAMVVEWPRQSEPQPMDEDDSEGEEDEDDQEASDEEEEGEDEEDN